jgi:hypothetical protein
LLSSCTSEKNATLILLPSPTATLDRLQGDEVLPGREMIFGIEVPRGLRIAARFADSAQLTGQGEPEAVANHFRGHVLAEHVEIGANRTIFPRVYVKGDKKKRIYRIEIHRSRNLTTVNIRDITPPPVPQGLSEKERWERAGRSPDGSLKDPLKAQ